MRVGPLGRLGLGLGTAPLGGLYDAVDDETARATLDRAWSLGLRAFDTAPLYGSGLSERRRHRGRGRAIGVGMNQTGLLCRFAREADPDSLLAAGRYTLLDRSAADELLPLCEERGIAVIAGGVFNSGVLADGDTYDYSPA